MSWEDLDVNKKELTHEQKLAQEQDLAIAKAYKRLFTTDDGVKVLNDLNQKFIYNNNTQLDAVNVNYESAYHNGESGVVKYCHTKMGLVENL